MDVDSYFDFDSISSSSSPRTPLDAMYHQGVSDLHPHQRFDDKQQQHIYGQQPSSANAQQEFFNSPSNPPSFPSTPDFNQQSFGVLANSPHWPTSPPPPTTGNDGPTTSAEAANWSYVTNSPLVQRYQSGGSTHDATGAPSPASFDQGQQSVNGGYAQQPLQSQHSSFDEQQQRSEPQYFRRSSNASFNDPSAFASPSPHLSTFQPHPQQPQQQQFFDPNAQRQSQPGYFTDMRLSSSHSTSSSASSALSEHGWATPGYEESPFVHHAPDDSLGAGGVIGTPGSYTSEPLPLGAGLDPLSLHDFETFDPQQQQPFQQQQQQQYFPQQQHQGSYSSDFAPNGVDLRGSPLVPGQQRSGSGYSNGLVQQHPHPYGSMGPSDSSTSLHSIHSHHSLHSQHSHQSLHGQYQQQQQSSYGGQHQQGFPGLSSLAGVLPSPPSSSLPGLSNSSGPNVGNSVTGMLGGIPGHIAVIHTDDANSKETQFLRRRCYNCRTTDPPSWRRSTLNTGKIVCNKCGLYERTHMRPRPPRFDEMRTGASTNGGSSAASAGVPAKARKGSGKSMGLIGGGGINGGVAGSTGPKGGIGKVRKEARERTLSRASAADSSRRGSFSSSASATSDWDEGLANYAASQQHASSSASPPNPGNNGVPIPNYNYGPTGSHIYGHSLPYPQLPVHSQSLDSGANGRIQIPRAPVMGLPRPAGQQQGATSTTSSRPTTSSGASGSGGSEENGSPFAAGIADSTSPNLGGSPLLQPPRKSATWSSGVGVGVDTMLISPSSSTPPPPISGAMAFSNGGSRSRKSSVVSQNAGGADADA